MKGYCPQMQKEQFRIFFTMADPEEYYEILLPRRDCQRLCLYAGWPDLLAIIIVLAVAGTIIPQEREIDAGPVLHFFYHTLELGSLYAANAMPNTISSPAPTASSFPGTKV
jgi:hypothetical protein